MTVVSYAVNLEDVLLHRVFAEVQSGKYVDVGAAHPEIHSVTKLFYDLGWSGVNIEPQDAYFDLLQSSRPRDVNLKVAAAAETGEKEFFTVVGFEELSSLKNEVASSMRQKGKKVRVSSVPTASLKDLLEHAGVREAHFLKIDVEGGESEVIAGIDFVVFRPWVIIVEVVAGDMTDPDLSWVARLEEAEYREVYFDGINKFFLAEEKSVLSDRFEVPVNVLDDYIVDYGLIANAEIRSIGEVVGAVNPLDGREVAERVAALFTDRTALQLVTESLTTELKSLHSSGATVGRQTVRLREIGEALGATDPANSREVSERVIALLSDRGRLHLLNEELTTELEHVRIAAAASRQESELLWQASWERERFIVGLLSDLHESRAQQGVLTQEIELAVVGIEAARLDAENRLNAVYRSSSWRLTLGLRALRHPRRYFRALRGR